MAKKQTPASIPVVSSQVATPLIPVMVVASPVVAVPRIAATTPVPALSPLVPDVSAPVPTEQLSTCITAIAAQSDPAKLATLGQRGQPPVSNASSITSAAAGVNVGEFRDEIVWFKAKLDPKAVLERVEAVAARS